MSTTTSRPVELSLRPDGHALAGGRAAGPLNLQRLQSAFGLVFATTLLVGIAYFPWMKGMPLGYVPVCIGFGLAWHWHRLGLHVPANRWLGRMTDRRFTVGLLGVAFLVRLVPALLLALPPVSDHLLYHQRALSMLRGDGYGATAFFAPGMAFWLLLVYRVFGASLYAAWVVNAVLGSLMAWLTYDVGRRVLPLPAARLGAALVALFPSLVLYALTLGNDPLIGCLLFAAVAMFLRGGAPGCHGWWYVALIGVILGGLSFVKPIGLLVPVVLGIAYWQRGAGRGRSLRNTVIMLICVHATLLPWSIRNYGLFGAYVPATTSAGANLWMTNHEGATPLTERLPEFPATMSEIEISQVLWQRSWDYILAHPWRFLSMQLPKFAYQWGTSSSVMATVSYDRWNPHVEAAAKGLINVAWSFVACFFVVAVVRDRCCRSRELFWPVIVLVGYLWGIHLFFEPQSRYHLPLLPAICMVAAGAMLRVKSVPAIPRD